MRNIHIILHDETVNLRSLHPLLIPKIPSLKLLHAILCLNVVFKYTVKRWVLVSLQERGCSQARPVDSYKHVHIDGHALAVHNFFQALIESHMKLLHSHLPFTQFNRFVIRIANLTLTAHLFLIQTLHALKNLATFLRFFQFLENHIFCHEAVNFSSLSF